MKARELEQRFDAGEDITGELDLSQARRVNQEQKRVNVDFPVWMVHSLDREAKRLGVPVAHGILVEYVFPGEAAARAGIRGGNRAGTYTYDNDGELVTDQCVVGGDVIVAVDGKPITGSNWEAWGQYTEACEKKPGDSVRLTLLRGNRRFTVTLPLDVIPYSSPTV